MKQDRRTRYTRQALKDALLDLMRERPLERIAVKELCERADVNRSTFYVYYASPQALFEEIKNDLVKEIRDLPKDYVHMDEFLRHICEAFYAHRQLLETLLRAHGHMDFLYELLGSWKDDFLLNFPADFPQEQVDMAYLFITCGTCAVIYTWALGGFRKTAQEIADTVYQLALNGISTYGT